MASEFESALRDMLNSVASEAASEAIRQQRVIDEERMRDGHGDRFLLRSHEAAEQLAISSATLNRLTRSGELPCVRVGRTVRYSTETIREWIREKESTDSTGARPKVIKTHQVSTKGSSARTTHSEPEKNLKRSHTKSKPAFTGKETTKKSTEAAEPESEEGLNPFGLLLKEIGVEHENIPNVTNGDLMRIAEVDTPVFHGWMYLNRELPDDALEKLRDHFVRYRVSKS